MAIGIAALTLGRQRASLARFPKNEKKTLRAGRDRAARVLRPSLGGASSFVEWNDLRSPPGAFAERLDQGGGAAMLLQQVVEGLIGKLLE